MSMKNEKPFDCLKYKDQIQSKIYEEIKDMNYEEEIEYFRKQAETGPLGEWWKQFKENAGKQKSRVP